ncbi:carboxymuconolactone decarboxylase family protein [Bordetella genomosp. 9]|uniref:4-carboxymuconolactone decarboxylase n=1 Tax=Bordetella genomosp. 9 TaxID=1416803 RepID=A0A1W6YZT2_9BORD|nr:carboxymuconolactone decarboxylase family protein [Bordetella genomosp. 9]ARP86632.1 4-carboxymuconolactone decarboxylase [Bordetella genomosp. 9]ARP90631.1 4-carboxymuconolactone decarboxylase [Bordetella genomosp. 9]
MPRMDPPSVEQMSAHQRRIHDAIASGPRGGVRGPLAIWLHRPGLAEHAQALGRYCRYDSSLPPRLSELAILTIAAWWRSSYEWWAHHPIALRAGVDAGVAEQIRVGEAPDFVQADESVVYRFVRSLLETRVVPDPLYREAVQALGADGVVDLVGIAGYYTLISMTINVFEIPPNDGSAVSFER